MDGSSDRHQPLTTLAPAACAVRALRAMRIDAIEALRPDLFCYEC